MWFLTMIATLASAACNAVSSVIERLATQKTDTHKLMTHRQALGTTFTPLFLIGLGIQSLAFVFQAFALSHAPLVIVEPLLTTDLLFLLFIIHFKLGIRVGLKEILAAAGMAIGLSGLFIAGNPSGGHLKYSLTPWLITTSLIAITVALLLGLVKLVESAKWRAFAAGVAAALLFALNAAFTKLAMNQLQTGGWSSVFSSWPVYLLICSGICSLYFMQMAFSVGPLAIAQPTIEVIEPTVSVIIGVIVFGDVIRHSAWALIAESISLLLVAWGIVILATSSKLHKSNQKGI